MKCNYLEMSNCSLWPVWLQYMSELSTKLYWWEQRGNFDTDFSMQCYSETWIWMFCQRKAKSMARTNTVGNLSCLSFGAHTVWNLVLTEPLWLTRELLCLLEMYNIEGFSRWIIHSKLPPARNKLPLIQARLWWVGWCW